MKKLTTGICLIFTVLFVNPVFGQSSPKKSINQPPEILEFHQLIQSEYSKGYYAEKFRKRKQTREKISSGLLPESILLTDTVNALTLMGQYPDLPGFYSQQQLQSQLYDGPNPTGTLTDYYYEVSYNQLYFTGDCKGWYNVSGNLQSYGTGTSGGPQFVVDVIEDSDPTLNYAEYIQYYDGQGKPHIGFIAVIHAGAGAEAGANNIWSHRWTFTVIRPPYITNDIDPISGENVIIDGPYAIMPERSGGSNTSGPLIEIGVFAHEFGHIFGIPDLYDTDGSSSGLGEWCLMASGSWGGDGSTPETPTHMSAWVKKELGWVTPVNITSLEEALSVPNVEENQVVYRMWGNGTITNQYFLIENRQRIGFDINIHNSGFLIYHVDDSQNNNRNEDHYKVDVEQADGQRGLNNGTNRGDAGDPFPGSTQNKRFDWNTNPDSKDYNLNNTFVSVRNIVNTGNAMIGDFDIQQGPYLYTEEETLLFEKAFVEPPLVKTVTITNYGFEDLTINNITSSVGPFTLLSNPSPVTLSTDESINIQIEFNPTNLDFYNELMVFDDNDPGFEGLTLNGQAYIINPANTGLLYASTGAAENGKILTLELANGAGTLLGISGFDEVRSLTVNPDDNILYGLSSNDYSTDIIKVNASGGDAFTRYGLDLGDVTCIAFDSSGTLFASQLNGNIYTVDLTSGNYSFVTEVNGIASVLSMTINQMTNEVWVVPNAVIGAKDKVYTLDLTTGDVTFVGQTGFNKLTNDMAFDENGNLYGIIGGTTEEGQLITIDTNDGTGTLVGNIGFQNVTGLAYSINGNPVSVEEENEIEIPDEFTLSQNYPNPFNPSTSIEYSLPVNSEVSIKIYNLLGEVVRTLVNEEKRAGHHSIVWNGIEESGKQASSGIYFYKMKAKGNNGKTYSEILKMVLLK